MDLTVQHLRYFLAVADELHFARAAERLHISPSSLSQQIQQLERRVGTPLFRRTSRQVQLTPRGADLVPLARSVAVAMDGVTAWADADRKSPRVFRIGVAAANEFTNAVLAAAVARFPDVEWQIHSLPLTDPLTAVRDGEVEVSLMIGHERPHVDGIETTPLWSEDRMLVVNESHGMADRESVRLEETDEETFIGIRDAGGAQGWFVDPRPSGVHPRILPLANQFDEVLQLCAAGVGVNICGATAASTHARPGLRYIPITDLPPVTTYLCRRKSHAIPLIDAFEAVAVEAVSRLVRR
ncbi:LysR family transcriptional regulator [Gordonia insulae]|uniref:HTH-type transcriptional regulator CynR n=1 Tax=Gordonia insulae TaxID=2420509 RepID=A0A3G8JNQ7_9ACTN|nr:LysR family transcriptional regulator [Gordonia insulae]AZG46588.1 HTH-type transcriptional regulator CynR [Gordonia insulae]